MRDYPTFSIQKLDLALHAIGLGTIAATVFATWTLAIGPMLQQDQVHEARCARENQLQASSAAIRNEHRDVAAQIAESEATFARVISRIPETPRESEFLAQVTHLSRTCQLKIHRYFPREPVNEGTHTALEVQLDASADYVGLCQFLDGLRTLSRLCRVTQLRIHTGGPEETLLPVEMTLRIYYAPLSQPTPPEARHG